MRTQISWAELHSPIFLNGTNLQQKLDPTKKVGLSLEYDEERKQLYVSYKGKTARVPEPSILSMVEHVAVTETTVVVEKRGPGRPIKAQASTPMDHVFAGEGGGKVRI